MHVGNATYGSESVADYTIMLMLMLLRKMKLIMRMRNLPWAKPYLNEHKHVVSNPCEMKGKWKQHLNRNILHVEIGCGKGDYFTKMGLLHNDCGWVAIEKNHSVAALAMKKFDLIEEDKNHMALIQDDATAIESWFDEKEVDVIHLNFSDPWPKKRAHKKRLSSHTFIKQYAKILSDDGEIQMKSDNKDLFEYERRFMNLNQPIYRAVWKKYKMGVLEK